LGAGPDAGCSRSRLRLTAVAVVALIAAASAVTACGGSDEGGGAGTELTFFIFNEPSGAYQEAAAKCSQESNGQYHITFEFLPAQADAQREQLVRRLGAEDDSIDIIGMDIIWTAEFANAGFVEPWSEADAQQVTENVFDSVVESATFEDTLYAAPFTSNTQLLWYRKDRVQQPPQTWDDMIAEAEQIGPAEGLIQVQANRYEGFTVLATAMIESAGAQILAGPTEVALEQAPTERALEVLGKFARSPVAPPDIDTSTEDTARLSFEAGGSSFMLNYPFVYPSAKENAPDVFKQMGFAIYPRIDADTPSRPPLGGIHLGVSAYSDNKDLTFEAIKCLVQPENQITAATLGGLPPVREDLYGSKELDEAYPGFANLIKKSIDNAAPRPLTPAYTDVSLAIQRSLHPPGDIDPQDVGSVYDDLYDAVDKAVQREGLF
jgi:multiple sugar transport system substrate-binding protein